MAQGDVSAAVIPLPRQLWSESDGLALPVAENLVICAQDESLAPAARVLAGWIEASCGVTCSVAADPAGSARGSLEAGAALRLGALRRVRLRLAPDAAPRAPARGPYAVGEAADESYSLELLPDGEALVSAAAPAGAVRGAGTLLARARARACRCCRQKIAAACCLHGCLCVLLHARRARQLRGLGSGRTDPLLHPPPHTHARSDAAAAGAAAGRPRGSAATSAVGGCSALSTCWLP